MSFKLTFITPFLAGAIAFGATGCTKKEVDVVSTPRPQGAFQNGPAPMVQQVPQAPAPLPGTPVLHPGNQPPQSSTTYPDNPASPSPKSPSDLPSDSSGDQPTADSATDPDSPVRVIQTDSGSDPSRSSSCQVCGSGGGGSSASAPAPTSAPVPTSAPAPIDQAPVVEVPAQCEALDRFETFLPLAQGWTAKFSAKLDLKGVKERKELGKELQQDLDEKGRMFALHAIYDGLYSLRTINPALACAVVEQTSRKKLNFEGPETGKGKDKELASFKRHKFLWFGAGRIILGETLFEAVALHSETRALDYYSMSAPAEAAADREIARAAIYEGFLDFANLPEDELTHEKGGADGALDSVLACAAAAFPQNNFVPPQRQGEACHYCAHVRPQSGGVLFDSLWLNSPGDAACGWGR